MNAIQATRLSLLFITLFFVSNPSSAQLSGFSGKWVIDKAKTNFGKAPEWVLPRALLVKPGKGRLRIDRTMLTMDLKEIHFTEEVPLDGSPARTTTATGKPETVTMTMTSDKAGFDISAEVTTPEHQHALSITEHWSLADDGNTLLIDRQVMQADGAKYGFKVFYNKQ